MGSATASASWARHNTAALLCAGQMPPLRRKYTVRVLVPCYKESLAIIQRTVLAARRADKPAGTRVIIYICDDGIRSAQG